MFSTTKTALEERCLNTAQRLISQCKAPVSKISSIADIDSNLIVLLFEDITNLNIPDLLHCINKAEEAHNVQAVIDTLSLDLLGISLSHITGEDVVAGNVLAISNLLEVLEGVSKYLTSSDQEKRSQEKLKRKFCRRKRSRFSLSNQSSSCTTDKPDGSVHSSGDSLSTKRKKKRSIHESCRVKPPQNTCRKKYFTSEDLIDNSTKQTSQKLIRHNEPFSLERAEAVFQQPDKNVENNKKVFHRKTKRRSRPHTQYTETEKENKLHIQSKATVSDSSQSIQTEERSSPKKMKRKTAKICPLRSNSNVQHPVEKEHEVEELYEKNLEKKIRVLLEKNCSYKPRAANMKKLHLQSVKKPLRKSPISACNKSFLLPYALRHRSISRTVARRVSPRKAPFSQKASGKNLPSKSKPGFIQELFEEFPGLHLIPQVVNHITEKYQKQLTKMHKQAKAMLLKKPMTQIQAEEAARKQSALSNILKKDILHEQHLKELKEHKKFESAIKFRLRDARLQSAKMKQYCDEFNVEMRKKMQKRNFTEELIFEKVFMDALKIQQEQVDRLCEEVKRTGENDARNHLIYLEDLENLYQSQFSLLSETLASEKRDAKERIKAEKQEMNSMQRKFREELRNEMRFMGQEIIESMEDTEFRKMDAEQYTMKLREQFS